jgi:hypothetical protein
MHAAERERARKKKERAIYNGNARQGTMICSSNGEVTGRNKKVLAGEGGGGEKGGR